ncbi:hypothetical protein R1flu_006985 [Riccia fluitans]|uniref:Uncharacterized protein n=1 Tax=Riccia fluitans TaxID=41844 RepID=A0ABD1YXJ5_9MARC
MLPTWNILKNALIEVEAVAGRFKTEHLSSWKHNRDVVLEWIALATSHLSNPPMMLPSVLCQNENESPRQEISQDNASMEIGRENSLEITPSTNLTVLAAVAPAELLLMPTLSLGSSAPQSHFLTTPEISRPMSTGTSSYTNIQNSQDHVTTSSTAQAGSSHSFSHSERITLSVVREESRRHDGRNANHQANCPFFEGAEAPECQNPVQLRDSIITSIEQFNQNQERNN